MFQIGERFPQSLPGLETSLLRDMQMKLSGSNRFDLSSLPIPHPLQAEILQSTVPFKIIAAGRKGGKTMMASMSAIGGKQYGGRGLFDGAQVRLSSPSQEQTDVFWAYITSWLSPLLKAPGFYKNESRRIIRYHGGEIRVKTASDPDSLRAHNLDKLILDECAYLHHAAWKEAGLPSLLATNGVGELYSTPKRRNWFFQQFVEALDPAKTDWHAWTFPSHANPYLVEEALQRMVENMTDDDYKQEILAEFLEGQGAVFRHVDERCTALRQQPPAPDAKDRPTVVLGIDWAQVSDYTVIVAMDKNTHTMLDYDRFNGVDWALQRGRLKTMADKWQPEIILAESNSIGSPNIEALQREGLAVTPFETTATSKPPLIESLVLAFDRGEITCLNDSILKGELMAYERKVSATGRSSYNAPEGMHDDMVIATALAWKAIQTPVFEMAWMEW